MKCKHCGRGLMPWEMKWVNDGLCDKCAAALEDKSDHDKESRREMDNNNEAQRTTLD